MKLNIDCDVSKAEADYVDEKLADFVHLFTGPRNRQGFSIVLRDDNGTVRGGILGQTLWDWLQIGTLWVEEDLRGNGHGHQLLEAAEALGVERGCRHARLATWEFEAREFYEAHGYAVFGQQKDFPQGHTQYYLAKEL